MSNFIFEPVKPIVETKFGKLRGVTYGDVNIFMGVKYAEAKRFHMPVEQQSWEGIKDAYTHGPVAMLTRPNTPFGHYRGLKLIQNYSEDCQNLNIWAPKTANGEKKPVFVWMHGGGYFAGNALEEYSFDGLNLAHYGDVVVVSVNHRLNIVAHMNMADYGDEFKNSVNVGMADLVASLKWINENIAAFGGDPDNVTIAGHSGGGGKIQAMYQIEEAAPYFARGIVLSGPMGGEADDAQEKTRAVAKAVMDELGITKENIEEVYEIPYEELAAAVEKVTPELAKKGIRAGWQPVKDDYFRGAPADVGFMPWSKDKPIIFGSTLGEFAMIDFTVDEKLAMTEEDKLAYLRKRFGEENADKLIELFKAAYPCHDNILDIAYADTHFRIPTLKAALAHAESGNNNTYIFVASYNSVEDGSIPIWHGGEVAYLLMNTDKCFVLNEAIYGEKYTNIFSTMTLNFMKTGNPNNKYLPEWKPLTSEEHNTMIIDKVCENRIDHDTEFIDLLVKVAPPLRFGL